MVLVVDRVGKVVRAFPTWKEANNFKIVMQRFDWRII